MTKHRETSDKVAAKASRLMKDDDPDVRAVAASAVSQAEPPKRGRPPIAEKVVKALEDAGEERAAEVAREAGGLPPRVKTPDELFLAEVVLQCTGGPPVGFNCTDEDDAIYKETLVSTILDPNGRAYKVVRKGPRIEVSRT